MQQSQLNAGILGGLIAGVVFGIMMGALGMFPMVGKLIGQETVTAGFVLHLIFSVIIGLIFSVIFGKAVVNAGQSAIYGLIYGVAWWILGPLVIMPVWLGMGVQLSAAGAQMALPSLWGHLSYGLILGLLYPTLAKPKQ